MNLDEVLKLIGVISAIIAALVTYFNKQYKKYESLQDEYFNKLLVSYVKYYRSNNFVNTVKYIKRNYSIDCMYIPRYVFYLVEKNNKENLHKVLICDYTNYYLNFENVIYKTFDVIIGIVWFLLTVIYFMLGFFIIYVIYSILFSNILQGNLFERDIYTTLLNLKIPIYAFDMIIIIAYVILFIILMSILKFIIKNKDDNYTLNLKRIEKKIKRKVKGYNKNQDKYFI